MLVTLRAALLSGVLVLSAAMAACSPATVAIPAVVCVGESTTYLDWLNGDLQPADEDPISQPASTAGDLLETIRTRGKIIVSSDPNYEPQSFLDQQGNLVGFDVDVAKAIAEGLGVDIEFVYPDWQVITAGNWAGQWDISVGSMTITVPRKDILSFTQPYYYTPATLAASTRSGVTSEAQLPFELPEGVTATTLTTDSNCAEAIQAGRPEFDLWISSGTTVKGAIDSGIPVRVVTDSIYVEQLAVAIDKSGPPHAALLYEIDKIIGQMHADGRLTALSQQWFDGEDLTKAP
jgi:polar amino acid transport system substrate-binding protein